MTIKGKVKNIYTKNDFNIITLTNGKKIRYIGSLNLKNGDYISCDGKWETSKYGETFLSNSFTILTSFSFLFSLFINGISEKTSDLIFEKYDYEEIKENPFLLYDYFLTDSSRKILEQIRDKREMFYDDNIDTIPTHLSKEIKGIGKKKVGNWLEVYTTYYDFNAEHFLSDNFLFYILSSETTRNIVKQCKDLGKIEEDYKLLRNYNIPDYALKYLVKDLKRDMLEKIKEDVFLLNEYFVSFPIIDNFAVKELNMELTDNKRIVNGIKYILMKNEKEGNAFMYINPCMNECEKLLGLTIDDIKEILEKEMELDYDSEFVLENDRLYRRVIYYTEQKLGKMILEKTVEENFVPDKIVKYLRGTNLSKNQQNCIIGSLKKKISIFTGGPGTGKTTSINELCNCLDMMGKTYLLTSPTGKAAKRMSESTNRESKTLHRLLEYKARGKFGYFQRNEEYKLYAHYIIVDESSMLDVFMLNSLLKATHPNTSIIFVGDVDQLPSVSMGSVFKDMKDSGVIPTYELVEVFRQGLNSDIIQNAYHVKNNEELQFENGDFFFEKIEEIKEVEEWLKKLKSEFLILCPMNVGQFGTIKMNKLMQEFKNHNSIICSHFDRTFKVGDKVIQLDNDYDKEVYNGDIGVIKTGDRNSLVVAYPDKEVVYDYKELNQIDLAYAISIHKSQGSESDYVVMIIDGNPDFITKELIYTGITRAKKKLLLLSTYDLKFYETLKISNDRCTNLCEILKKNVNEKE